MLNAKALGLAAAVAAAIQVVLQTVLMLVLASKSEGAEHEFSATHLGMAVVMGAVGAFIVGFVVAMVYNHLEKKIR